MFHYVHRLGIRIRCGLLVVDIEGNTVILIVRVLIVSWFLLCSHPILNLRCPYH